MLVEQTRNLRAARDEGEEVLVIRREIQASDTLVLAQIDGQNGVGDGVLAVVIIVQAPWGDGWWWCWQLSPYHAHGLHSLSATRVSLCRIGVFGGIERGVQQ